MTTLSMTMDKASLEKCLNLIQNSKLTKFYDDDELDILATKEEDGKYFFTTEYKHCLYQYPVSYETYFALNIVLSIMDKLRREPDHYMARLESNQRESIGDIIRDIRTNKNLTQQQLADNANIERATVSKVEAGKFNVSLDLLTKICKALNSRIDIVAE